MIVWSQLIPAAIIVAATIIAFVWSTWGDA